MAQSSETGKCILVVDDDSGIRALLKELLERAGHRVAEASSGTEAIAKLRDLEPDMVISDVQMQNGSGYEVCRTLRRQMRADVPFIFLSGTRTEVYDRVAGFEFGADDYIVKPLEPEELLARVRALLRRGGSRGAATPERPHGLTRRELEVLQLLAEGRSQQTIAHDLFLSESTVAKHIERILKKLSVRSRAEAVARAHQENIVSGR